MIEFRSSPTPTIGVELELQILDRRSLSFMNAAPEILRAMKPRFGERIKEEFVQSMVEINTAVCKDMAQAEVDLRESLQYLEGVLDGMDAIFYSASLHPLEEGKYDRLTDKPRYHRIMDDLQMVGKRFICQGLHVHIGVSSAERAIRVNNHMRMYLPLLLAITTSSPFYCGEETGLYSYRTKLFEALPLAGLPDSLDGWEEFCRVGELLIAGGIIESVKDLWWDVRPHPDFGTVEVRVCDIPCSFRNTLAVTALIQSLVSTLGNLHIHPDTRVQMQLLRANKWQAARYGLDGVFLNPVSATKKPMRDAVLDLLELVSPEAEALGAKPYLEPIHDILRDGTCAHRQISIYRETGDLRKMISLIREGYYS